MIHGYKIWKLLENLGDGKETFTQKISTKNTHLDMYGCPETWGEEIYSAEGTLTYTAELSVDSAGINEISFSIEKIELDLEIVTGFDERSYEIYENREFVIDKFNDDQVTVEVYSLPYYLNNLTINFSQAESLDGELIPEKVIYEMQIGSSEE